MKKRYLLISFVLFLGGVVDFWYKPAYSSATIIRCRGKIPNKTACLIEPSTYKIDTYRVDICQENPFPNYRSSSDYSGARCVSLFNGNGKLYKGNLGKISKFVLPDTGREAINPATYKYLTIVLKNSFTSSGKYTSGNTTWRTLGNNPQNLSKSKGQPIENTVRLRNWRGKNNSDNDYCNNNGGTPSRCELNYNGYQLTAIGLGSDFIESFGPNVEYMFYMVELRPPAIWEEGSEGYFDIRINNALEVYGDGTDVTSISVAPFVFQVQYKKNRSID